MILTNHAVSQYISRFNREMKFDSTRQYLEKQLTYAKKLNQLTRAGQELWELPNGARLVTKRDGTEYIIVTILKEGNGGFSEDEEELVKEAMEKHLLPPPPEVLSEHSYNVSVNIKLNYKMPAHKDCTEIESKLHKAIEGAIKGVILNKTFSFAELCNAEFAFDSEGS